MAGYKCKNEAELMGRHIMEHEAQYGNPGKHFIQAAIKHPGALHESLGVPQGEKIPESKMESAEAGNYGPKAKKRAQFAEELKGFHK